MKKISGKLTPILLLCCFQAHALTLDQYLAQVQQNNDAIKGAVKGEEAKSLRRDEGKLLFKPSFFLTGEFSDDKRITLAPSFQGNRTIRNSYRAGISNTFETGTTAAISYNIYRTELMGVDSKVVRRPIFTDVAPTIELTQSLWKNWLGKETKSKVEIQNSQNEAARLADQYTYKQLMIQAENVYWRLYFSQSRLRVQEESLERTKKIREWNLKRFKNNLVDEADFLQADANYQGAEVEYQSVVAEIDSAKREFNSIRQLDEEVNLLGAQSPDTSHVMTASLPKKMEVREDVMIAMTNQKIAEANAQLGVERNKPNLEVYGQYSLNGRDRNYGKSDSMAWEGTHPWTVIGVRFSTPLDIGAVNDYKKSYEQDKVAAQLNYKRKSYEVEKEWEILNSRLDLFRKRLKLSYSKEKAEEKKYAAERKRFDQGRTTTFQVVQFEQDLANAQLVKLRNELEVITTFNQLKLFSGEPYVRQ